MRSTNGSTSGLRSGRQKGNRAAADDIGVALRVDHAVTEADADLMEGIESRALSSIGIPDPYA